MPWCRTPTRTELQGLKDRRGLLDKSRREPEELIAPVEGSVAEGTVAEGQMAQSNAVIFHIVDPSRLWVEALSFDSLPGVHSAVARFNTDRTYQLAFRGTGFAGRNQSIPVQFVVQGDAAGLCAGQFVTVLATTYEEKTGFAIPRASAGAQCQRPGCSLRACRGGTIRAAPGASRTA